MYFFLEICNISFWQLTSKISILHPKVGRSLLKMHDISWNWMLIHQVWLLLPDCLVHLHPDGRTKQGWGPMVLVPEVSRCPGVNIQVTWLVCFLFGRFATITQPHREWPVWVMPFRLSSCCSRPLRNAVSREHPLLLVCFVLMYVFVWLSDCEQRLPAALRFLRKNVGENPLLHVSYVELVHPSTT